MLLPLLNLEKKTIYSWIYLWQSFPFIIQTNNHLILHVVLKMRTLGTKVHYPLEFVQITKWK